MEDLDAAATVEGVAYVQCKRFAVGAALFGAVEHSDAFRALGEGALEVFEREGTVEVDAHQTELAAFLLCQIVDGLLDGVAHRTHSHDDILCLGISVVVERQIVAAGDLCDLAHVAGHDVGNGVVVLVGSLAGLEVYVGVLRGTAGHGFHGVEGTLAEALQSLVADQRTEVFALEDLNLLDFVGGAETVKEVQERQAALDGCKVSHGAEVHRLLRVIRYQEIEAGGTGSHHVLMVAKDRECLGCQGARRYVEHAGQHLAGNFIHIRNHEQQTLRRSEGRCQGTSLQRTVHRTGGTGLTLHLCDRRDIAEHIFLAVRYPLVEQFCHSGRGCDGVNSSVLAEQICGMSSCVVTVTRNKFLCHLVCFNYRKNGHDRSRALITQFRKQN